MVIMNYLAQPEKRNVSFNGKRTSLQLERYIWQNLGRVSRIIQQSNDEILTQIWNHKKSMGMAPAVRLFLSYFYSSYVVSLHYQQQAVMSDGDAVQDNDDSHAEQSTMRTAEAAPDRLITHEMDCYQRALGALFDIAI